MEGSKYDLRDRSRLQPPQRYGYDTTNIRALDRKRTGKRSGVIRRIENISKHILDQESRTKLRFLLDDLKEFFKTLVETHEAFMLEIDETDDRYNDEFIEEVGVQVSNCASSVNSYLETRHGDPSSSEGSEKEARILAWREALEAYSETSSTSSALSSEKPSSHHEPQGGSRLDETQSLVMDFKSLSMLSSKPEAKEEVLEGEHDLNFHNMLSFKEHSDKLLYPTLYNLSDNTVVEYMSGGFGELTPG